MSTNFLINLNGQLVDLANLMVNQTSQSITLSTNDTTNQQYSMTFKRQMAIRTNDIKVAMNGYCITGSQTYTFGPATQRLYVGTGSINNMQGNTLAFSYDGTSWVGLGSSTFNVSANAIAYNGRIWSVVGEDSFNSIAFSWDGKTWFGLGQSIFGVGNAVACNNTMFVAGGTGSNTLAYSYDGINWIGLGTSVIATAVTAIAWNGMMWQAGSNTGQIAYSYDGIVWTLSTNITGLGSNRVNHILWTGSIWFLSGNSSGLNLYSTDGITWTNTTAYSVMLPNQFAWNGNLFMGVGSGSSVSYTGIPLSNTWLTFNTTMSNARCIKWNGKKYIILGLGINTVEMITYPSASPYLIQPSYIGYGRTVFTSGSNFEFSINNPHSVTFPAYMVVSGGASMNYSYNGNTWTAITPTIFSSTCNCVEYNGKIWVAGGSSANGNTLAFSYDGRTWRGIGNAVFSTACNFICWNGTIWVAVGSGSNLAYSYDGILWVPVLSSFLTGGNAIAYNGKIFVAGGTSSTIGNSIIYSSDGMNWLSTGQTAFSTGVSCICWNGSKWAAVGSGGNSIAYSFNGINWTGVGTATFTTGGNQIAWNGTVFMATGGTGNCAAMSYDGVTWSGLGNTPFNNSGLGIGWDGSRWQMGNASASSAAYSFDGRTWISYATNATTCFGTNYNISPIPYIQHPTIAIGYGNYQIAYSEDGITWKGVSRNMFSAGGSAVEWNGSMWIAVGGTYDATNTMAYSIDGINWTGLGCAVFSNYANGIAWNGSMWVATGNDPVNTLAYSLDGYKWVGLGNSVFSTQGFGVAWNGTAWVAMGQGGNTIAYSLNGITWTGVGSSIFEIAGTNVASDGTYWIATGSGGSTLAYTTVKNGSSGWTPISLFAYMGYGIAWNGSIWVATGGDPNYTIAYSTNGISWTGVNNSKDFFQYNGNGVCWNGVRFVTGGYGYGNDTILYSSNGINWYSAYVGYNASNTSQMGTAQLFTQCISVASNPCVGVPVVQSQLILNQQPVLAISSGSYYQNGYNEISFKIEQNNMY